MKTILVVYTNIPLSKKEYVSMKQYAFNTKANLKVGEIIKSLDYTTSMQVVEILPKAYKYVNLANGELGNKRDSTRQFELRTIVIPEKEKIDNNIVIAKRVSFNHFNYFINVR